MQDPQKKVNVVQSLIVILILTALFYFLALARRGRSEPPTLMVSLALVICASAVAILLNAKKTKP